jgi:hypothetical protein
MANRLKMAEAQAIIALAQLGWSQRRIAAEVGVDRGTVSRHVRAARGDPGPAGADAAGSGGADDHAAGPNAATVITGSDAIEDAGGGGDGSGGANAADLPPFSVPGAMRVRW